MNDDLKTIEGCLKAIEIQESLSEKPDETLASLYFEIGELYNRRNIRRHLSITRNAARLEYQSLEKPMKVLLSLKTVLECCISTLKIIKSHLSLTHKL